MNDSHDVSLKRFRSTWMSKVNQKESVVNEVKALLGNHFDATLPVKDQLTADQITLIKGNIVSGIMGGSISYSKDIADSKGVAKYVAGMVSNHFRKAKELNGGNTYSPDSTGRGSRDPQVSELNKLLKTMTESTEEYNQVVSAIASRKTEIAAEKSVLLKQKKKQKELASLNTEVLPESLRNLATNLVNNA